MNRLKRNFVPRQEKPKNKTTGLLLTAVIGSALSVAGLNPEAQAIGVNAENFAPAVSNHSALLHDSPYTIAPKAWTLGVTMDYAFRPVELGDGNDVRESILDHLWMTHLSGGYGVNDRLEVSAVLPFALLSSHENPRDYLVDIGASRSSFLLSDIRAAGKLKVLEWGTAFAGTHSVAAEIRLPSGSKSALLSDDTTRAKLSIPSSLFSTAGDWEISLNPGLIFWGNKERVIGDTGFAGGRRTLLARSWAASWDSSFRWTVLGTNERAGHLGLEAGIRTEFSQGYIALNSAGNPWEWGFGGRYLLRDDLTLHSSFGTGLGRGVGSPLFRLMAGVRWSGGGVKEVETEDSFDLRDVGKDYTDTELDRILAEAQAEDQPKRVASDESLLRLMVEGRVVDIGFIRFDFDSSRLSAEANETIDALMQQILVEKPKRVHIEGHTDSVGSLAYNVALSKRRADSVKKALISRGLEAEIITTSGAAFRFPVASNSTKQGRAANRRIEVALDGSEFRKSKFTPAELKKFQEWIAPGGRRPKRD